MKRHLGFIVFFSFIICLFLGRLIIMKDAFLAGDYVLQHYPWSKIYAEAIRGFTFPFWTNTFGSGFPLMAEGQIGGFYPLNIIMFFILPFDVAYNYSIILHFILAGIFTYAYSRKLGADQWGGSLAALTFCFGSAYAGCFNNTATLRTLSWFPLVLLLMEKFLDSKRTIYIFSAALICGMQFLTGFTQMAVYSFVFYVIYLLYQFKLKHFTLKDTIKPIFIFATTACIASLPQMLLTLPLAGLSGRAEASLGFALWKSFLPPCLISTFFPSWTGYLGQQTYVGILSLLFVIYAFVNFKYFKHTKPIIVIMIIAFLCAFGKYNPLYVILLKLTHIYSFRNPSRFLFFVLFGCSILAGLGFSSFFKAKDAKPVKTATKIFMIVLGGAISAYLILKTLIILFSDNIALWLKGYVTKHIFEKPYHRYDLQSYIDKANNLCLTLKNEASFSNPHILFSLAMILTAIATAIVLYNRKYRENILKKFIFSVITLDLFVYSFYGTGFSNMQDYKRLEPSSVKILEILKSDKEIFRILPFDLLDGNMPRWVSPNANILYGLESVAVYTPLALEKYRLKLASLEVVDDSLGLLSPEDKALYEKHQLIRILNVKYVVSARTLKFDFLENVKSEGNVFLYKLKDYLPRIFFTDNISYAVEEMPLESLKIIEYKNGFANIDITAPEDGFLILSENYYPGWVAHIDGVKAKILLVNDLIQAVELTKGHHTVIFKYRPTFLLDKK